MFIQQVERVSCSVLFVVQGCFSLNTLLGVAVHTVKPFNLAALIVGDLACKIILVPIILAN